MSTDLATTTKTVAAIMTSRVVTIEMDDTLEAVRDIFGKVKFHHLIVVDSEKIVGIISDRDLLKAISPYVDTMSETNRDRATLAKKAHQIMSHYPITVQKSCPIQKAARLMLEKRVSCLPVMASNGRVEGIITWKDMFAAFLNSPHSESEAPHQIL